MLLEIHGDVGVEAGTLSIQSSCHTKQTKYNGVDEKKVTLLATKQVFEVLLQEGVIVKIGNIGLCQYWRGFMERLKVSLEPTRSQHHMFSTALESDDVGEPNRGKVIPEWDHLRVSLEAWNTSSYDTRFSSKIIIICGAIPMPS